MNNDDHYRLRTRLTEALTSTMYALQGDPDEEASPLSMGSTLADVVLREIESAGFQIVRQPRG